MNGTDAAAVRDSLMAVGDADLAGAVYARLFARHPHLAAEFWRDGSGAIPREMLARALETLVALVDGDDGAGRMLAAEATTHDAYGIDRAIFGDFFVAIEGAVAAALGPGFTPAMAAGWAAVHGAVAGHARPVIVP